jgi:hypothetical protein
MESFLFADNSSAKLDNYSRHEIYLEELRCSQYSVNKDVND